MIESIHFNCYRKLKNIDINFSKNINIISGTNGTCKSSILHVVSNSFQSIKTKDDTELKKCLPIIKAINDQYNPKIETLTRGDRKFQDPAPEHKGAYYTVNYYGSYSPLSFRRHNSRNPKGFRYAIKPSYRKSSSESLPSIPVIYLGLNRLVTYGEYKDNEPIINIKQSLPNNYLEEIVEIYESFTGYKISNIINEKMGSVKIRADFESSQPGIDSNTISAGEDNLYIILSALECLKYYYDSLSQHDEVDSIFLIDEFDATLHPAFQYKLLDIVLKYSNDYNIQVIFTSHSLSLIEYCLKKKQNLLYLYDNETSILLLENPSIYKINMYLKNITKTDFAFERRIPVFTEDAEARYLLDILFKYYSDKHDEFRNVYSYFYFVDANIGGDTLNKMFKDPKLKTFTGQICILDGDKNKNENSNISNRVIFLPGNASPEIFLINYAETLYGRDDAFWTSDPILEENMGKLFYNQTFLPAVNRIEEKINKAKESQNSTNGIRREETKKLFNTYKKFFHLLFDKWLSDLDNKLEIDEFYSNLFILFKQVADINGIDSSLWKQK